MKLKIGIDIDSTLYPSHRLFIQIFKRLYKIDLRYKQDFTEWNFADKHNIDNHMFATMIADHFHNPETILGVKPYAGAPEVIQAWYEAGHQIHIVSHRHPSTTRPTLRWLREQGIPFHKYNFQEIANKVAYVKEEGLDIMIDDRPDTISKLINNTQVATIWHPYIDAVMAKHPELVVARTWRMLDKKLTERVPALVVGA